MKQETKEKMDKIAPLLAHLLDGGTIIRTIGMFTGAKYSLMDSDRILNELVTAPSGWGIHHEPRVIYVNECNGIIGLQSPHYHSEELARLGFSHASVRPVRFIEDLSWKSSNPPTNPSLGGV